MKRKLISRLIFVLTLLISGGIAMPSCGAMHHWDHEHEYHHSNHHKKEKHKKSKHKKKKDKGHKHKKQRRGHNHDD